MPGPGAAGRPSRLSADRPCRRPARPSSGRASSSDAPDHDARENGERCGPTTAYRRETSGAVEPTAEPIATRSTVGRWLGARARTVTWVLAPPQPDRARSRWRRGPPAPSRAHAPRGPGFVSAERAPAHTRPACLPASGVLHDRCAKHRQATKHGAAMRANAASASDTSSGSRRVPSPCTSARATASAMAGSGCCVRRRSAMRWPEWSVPRRILGNSGVSWSDAHRAGRMCG